MQHTAKVSVFVKRTLHRFVPSAIRSLAVRASLFSCFTGLRLSDVRSLTWGKIVKAPDGKTLYIRIKMQKSLQKISDEGKEYFICIVI